MDAEIWQGAMRPRRDRPSGPPETLSRTLWLLKSDAHRVAGRARATDVVRLLVAGETYPYLFWFRVTRYCAMGPWAVHAFLLPARLVLRRLRYRMGVNLPWRTIVGPGLLLGHAGGVVVSSDARIGADCNISQNVTIGLNKGTRAGAPTIGDRVYVGPGVVIAGAITVGDDVAIGANSVVLDDVPPGVTVAGAPARVVSQNGSAAWINRTDYPQLPMARRRTGRSSSAAT